MTIDLARKVLALFGAVTTDGGEEVLRLLRDALTHSAPFDDGELLLTLVADLHRRPLGDDHGGVADDDVVQHLASHPAPLRIDLPSEADVLPRTRERLARARHQSLLALPIVPGEGLRGAVVLASRRSCAFAAVPLQPLVTLASAAGLALLQALKLTGLHDEQEAQRSEIERLREALAAAQRSHLELEARTATARAELAAARRVLDERRTRHESDLAGGQHEAGALQVELLALRRALEEQRGELDAARARAAGLAGRDPSPTVGTPAAARDTPTAVRSHASRRPRRKL
jgi:hypothetical protein